MRCSLSVRYPATPVHLVENLDRKTRVKIGFIGAGQMAQALAVGIVSQIRLSEVSTSKTDFEFWISDPNSAAIESFANRIGDLAQVNPVGSNPEIVLQADTVFVAVKPQFITQALNKIDRAIENSSSTILISIVAGVTLGELRRLTHCERIIRAMPNTPCLIGKGAIGYAASQAVSPKELAIAIDLLASVGKVHKVSEANLDAVTGLSGSGPAYVFTFIEALTDGGVLNGLPRDVAADLALQTVLGSAELARQTGEHTAVLRDRVTSPGGTTIAGLKALEETGFRDAIMSAVSAATERSIELGS